MVLSDGKGNGNNVLAVDEEGNTIVEAADGSGVVMDSGGNIIAAGDAEGNVVLSGCILYGVLSWSRSHRTVPHFKKGSHRVVP